MSSIDRRTVEMQFDNGQFQNGIRSSIDSLDKLKKGLDLNGAGRGLQELERAGRSFSLAGIANGVDTISSKFTNLGIVGVTALQNITNSAVNAGKNMVKSLTIAPITTGFTEYETKMNAIQTILTNTASKGTKLTDVNKALAELNTYADKTIYNFADMTRNIGTFTAAGVDLETSVASIKGIANLAAGSGSNNQQASTAMYQLSQAIAAGKVGLQDWNSVVNAGMGGEYFQNALKKTAKEMGIVIDESLSFRESISAKKGGGSWLTSEVLTKTLKTLSEDELLTKAATEVKTFTQMIDTMKESVGSGWATTWENIIGDKAQAAMLFTSINDAFGSLIGPSTDARNAMLKFWNANGGRDAVIEGLSNAFKGLQSILKPINEAFREVFPAMTGERLTEISKNFRDLTKNFKIGEGTADKIKTIFKGIFSVFSIIGKVIGFVVQSFGMLFGITSPLGGSFLDIAASMGSFLTGLNDSIKASGIFKTALDNVKKLLENIPNLFSGMGKISPIFQNIATNVGNAFKGLGDAASKGMSNISFDKIFDVLSGGLIAGILLSLRKLIKSFTSVTDGAGGFFEGVTDMLDGVKDSMVAYQNQLKAGTLLKIAAAIAILAASLVVLSLIDPEKLGSALSAITVLFIELFGAMGAFEKIVGGMGFKSLTTITVGMTALSISILLLSFAMTNLAKLDWNGVAKGLVSVGALAATLVATAKVLSANSGTMIKGAMGFVIFAGAILLLTTAVEKLGKMDIVSLAKGLGGVAGILTEMAIFMKVTDLSGLGIKSSISILIMAAAISKLGDAVSKFGNMSAETFVKGLAGVGIVLMELALFMDLTGDAKMVISTAIALQILAGAMVVLAKAIKDMGSMSIDTLAKGLGTLALSLIILNAALKFMSGSLKGAAALLIVAGAMAILAPVLKSFGKMSLKEIAKSLGMLAGVFIVIGVAGALLTPVVPTILALGAALILIGIGVTAVGGGLVLIGAGLAAIGASAAIAAGGLVIVVTTLAGMIPMIAIKLVEGITAFANAFILAVPIIVQAVMTFLTAMLNAVVTFTPQLIDGGMKMINGFLTAIRDNIPTIVTTAVDIIVAFINTITTNLPRVIQAGFDLIIGFINGLAEAIRGNTDTLLAAIENLILALIEAALKVLSGSETLFNKAGDLVMKSLQDGIKGKFDSILTTTNSLPGKIIKGFGTFIGGFTTAGKNLIGGFIGGIKSKIDSLATTAASMAQTALSTAERVLGINSPSREFMKLGMYSNEGFANGLSKFSGVVASSARNVGTTAMNALSGSIANISDIVNGNMMVDPTIRPVLDLTNVESGLASAFGKPQGINVAGVSNKTSNIAALDQNRRMGTLNTMAGNVVDNTATNYNVIVNNPKPEAAPDSLRKTLLRYSYGV